MDDINRMGLLCNAPVETLWAILFLAMVQCSVPRDRVSDEWYKYQMECLDENFAADPETILRIKAGYWDCNDVEIKKWVHCLYMKYNVMNNNGEINFQAVDAVNELDKEDYKHVIDSCTNDTAGYPPYEKAWTFFKCYNNRISKRSFTLL